MLLRVQEKILSVKVKLRLFTVHLSTISAPTCHAFILTAQDVKSFCSENTLLLKND